MSTGVASGGRFARLQDALLFAILAYSAYAAVFGGLPSIRHRVAIIGALLCLTLLEFAAEESRASLRALRLGLVLAMGAASLLLFLRFDDAVEGFFLDRWDELAAGVFTLIMLSVALRQVGRSLFIMLLVACAYALWGDMLGGSWGHPRMAVYDLLERMWFGDQGYWGSITAAITNIVVPFMIFGGIMFATGGGETFVDLALILVGRTHGGASKAALISSVFFGAISGSPAASASTTGVFTIPLMIRSGYGREQAAAIETAAATAGQVCPPIMGAGAFIMAELLGVPYSQIARAAIIPAAAYLLGAWMMIDSFSRTRNIRPLDPEIIAAARSRITIRGLAQLFLPITVLVGGIFSGRSVQSSAITAAATAVVVFIALGVGGTPRDRAARLVPGLRAIRNMLNRVATIAIAASLIVGVLGATGIGVKLVTAVGALSGGSLLAAGILVALIATGLGMGVSPTADYLITQAIVGPVLLTLGVPPMVMHLFIFYFSCNATMTPPVGAVAFICASIAQADFWRVGALAMLVASASFSAPLIFLAHPELVTFMARPEMWNFEGLMQIFYLVWLIWGACITVAWTANPPAQLGRWSRAVAAALLIALMVAIYSDGAWIVASVITFLAASASLRRMARTWRLDVST